MLKAVKVTRNGKDTLNIVLIVWPNFSSLIKLLELIEMVLAIGADSFMDILLVAYIN